MGGITDGLAALQRFMETFTPYINKAVIFFLLLFIGFLVGKILGRLVSKVLSDLKADEFTRRVTGIKLSLERLLSGAISGLVYLLSIILALDYVGLTTAVIESILIIAILAGLLSIFLATRDAIQNAGARLTWRKELAPGAYIKMEEAEGEIKEVNLLETVIETRNGDLIMVPNALFRTRAVQILKRRPARRGVKE